MEAPGSTVATEPTLSPGPPGLHLPPASFLSRRWPFAGAHSTCAECPLVSVVPVLRGTGEACFPGRALRSRGPRRVSKHRQAGARSLRFPPAASVFLMVIVWDRQGHLQLREISAPDRREPGGNKPKCQKEARAASAHREEGSDPEQPRRCTERVQTEVTGAAERRGRAPLERAGETPPAAPPCGKGPREVSTL